MPFEFVCPLADLPEGGTREACLVIDGLPQDIFLVRRGSAVHAYVNRCPHTGSPLNWMPNDFLDETGREIICATHAARFRISDGLCVLGPCVGLGLQGLKTRIWHENIYVEAD